MSDGNPPPSGGVRKETIVAGPPASIAVRSNAALVMPVNALAVNVLNAT